jgi:hypothetical protein
MTVPMMISNAFAVVNGNIDDIKQAAGTKTALIWQSQTFIIYEFLDVGRQNKVD